MHEEDRGYLDSYIGGQELRQLRLRKTWYKLEVFWTVGAGLKQQLLAYPLSFPSEEGPNF